MPDNIVDVASTDVDSYLKHHLNNKCLCWWCCHAPDLLSQTPVPLAVAIRQTMTGTRWVLKGYFCSIRCGLAYAHDNQNRLPHDTIQITRNLWMVYAGLPMIEHVQKAPSRQALQVFGGDLTIAEFRQNSRSIQCHGNILIFSITEALDMMTAAAATAQRPVRANSSVQKRRIGRAALKPQNTLLKGNPQNIDMRRKTTQRLDYSKAEIFLHRAPSRDPTKLLSSNSAAPAKQPMVKNVKNNSNTGSLANQKSIRSLDQPMPRKTTTKGLSGKSNASHEENASQQVQGMKNTMSRRKTSYTCDHNGSGELLQQASLSDGCSNSTSISKGNSNSISKGSSKQFKKVNIK